MGQPSRKENVAIAGPARDIGPATTIAGLAIRGTKPHRLIVSYRSKLAAIGASDANVTPVVPGILLEVAILKEQPLAVGRPTRPKVEVIGMSGQRPGSIRRISLTQTTSTVRSNQNLPGEVWKSVGSIPSPVSNRP